MNIEYEFHGICESNCSLFKRIFWITVEFAAMFSVTFLWGFSTISPIMQLAFFRNRRMTWELYFLYTTSSCEFSFQYDRWTNWVWYQSECEKIKFLPSLIWWKFSSVLAEIQLLITNPVNRQLIIFVKNPCRDWFFR